MNSIIPLLGRVGLSLIFIISGWGKIAGYAATQGYMASEGVPGELLPLVIALELGGGLAILAGLFTRWAAFALAAFSLVSPCCSTSTSPIRCRRSASGRTWRSPAAS